MGYCGGRAGKPTWKPKAWWGFGHKANPHKGMRRHYLLIVPSLVPGRERK